MKRVVYRVHINFGYLPLISALFNAVYLFVDVIIIRLQPISLTGLLAFCLLNIPFILLLILCFPLSNLFVHQLMRKPRIVLHEDGIFFKSKFFPWKEIKSISFHNGKQHIDDPFTQGLRLFSTQRMFLLDIKGQELECIIDIDYWGKSTKQLNNMLRIRDYIHALGYGSLLSDWAQKSPKG